LLIARLEGQPIGCGALKFHAGAPAELKRMWVAPAARGVGLGRRLLAELERHAWDNGVKVLRLETNGALTEAIALYRSAGYRAVAAFNDEPYAQCWFEKRLSQPARYSPSYHRRGPEPSLEVRGEPSPRLVREVDHDTTTGHETLARNEGRHGADGHDRRS
jgi:hypothetical protein